MHNRPIRDSTRKHINSLNQKLDISDRRAGALLPSFDLFVVLRDRKHWSQFFRLGEYADRERVLTVRKR
jgi:hypothetical protein